MSKSNLTKADQVYLGGVNYTKYNTSSRHRGLRAVQLFTHEFGAVEAKDADGICVAQGSTGAVSFTVTGALTSGGVATLTTPRAVSITSTANESSDTFTITGTDEYGEAMTEDIAGPNATTKNGAKAFKTVTAVAVGTALTSTQVTVGTSDVLGLPIRLADKGKLVGVTTDGLTSTSSHTIVVGFGATKTSTATTADIRGTITPGTVPNGTIRYNAQIIPDGNKEKAKVFGVTQA